MAHDLTVFSSSFCFVQAQLVAMASAVAAAPGAPAALGDASRLATVSLGPAILGPFDVS